MKLKIQAGELARVISKVIAGCKGSNFSILSSVLLRASKGSLEALSTDLSALTIRYNVQCKTKEEGSVLVDADSLLKAAGKLNASDEVTLETNGKTSLSVTCGKYKLSLPLSDVDEYPQIAGVDDVKYELKVKSDELKRTLTQVIPSISSDMTRSEFTGLWLILNGCELNAVSTDGHRLSFVPIPVEVLGETEFSKGIIMAGACVRFVSKEFEGDVSVAYHKGKIVFTNGTLTVQCGTLSGAFPDYSKVIPSVFGVEFDVDRKQLLSTIKRVNDFSSKTGAIRINISKKTLTAYSEFNGKEVQDVVEGDIIVGEIVNIGLNGKYVLDALNVVSSGVVRLCATDCDSPFVLQGIGDNAKFIIMPMQI